MISKIERGEASPTAALLGRLSAAFGLTMSQLFARVEGGGGRVTRAAEQPTWRDPATGFTRRSLTPPDGAPLELVWGEMPPSAGVDYPAESYRFLADQQIVVMEGRLTVVQGAERYELGPGDCMRFGPPRDSAIRNDGTAVCRYLVAVVRASSGA
jgi:transcriptional regulator with XRE-family HTH domain